VIYLLGSTFQEPYASPLLVAQKNILDFPPL